jgi:SpoVK/Ycf46/Vps4 family AAA+-type ATPase
MSFARRIEEQAISVAKKYDHTQVTPLHILLALSQKSTDLDQEITKINELLKTLKQEPTPVKNQISITAEATDILKKCADTESGDKVKVELLKSLLEVDYKPQKEESEVKSEKIEETQSLEQCLAQLNSLVGLDEVKQQINKLISVHKANLTRELNNLPKVPVGLHLVFTGSPGTGKTTVARIVSRIYKSLGLLPKGHLIEVDRSQLVAGYVGQTALKVNEVISDAEGGVLFIDEAYALAQDSGAGFGDEAISTIVKAMEDKRDSLAVIVAGYESPMEEFIKSNQGLKSRFQNKINFADYSSKELITIMKNITDSHKIKINSELEKILVNHFENTATGGDKGNARYARNLFEKMYLQMSSRADADGSVEMHEITELLPHDFPEEIKPVKRNIGFTD